MTPPIKIATMTERALEILAEVARTLTAGGVEGGLQQVAEAALTLTEANHASVRLRGEGVQLEVGARAGQGSDRPPPPFRVGEGVLGWVAQHGRPANVADAAADPRFRDDHARPYPAASVLAVPILDGERTLGVLSLSAAQRAAFDAGDEAAAALLASTAAQALVADELRRMAVTDSQTGAFNHRHLRPRLSEEMERARRTGEPLSLLLLDLDHFKAVNDAHGHVVGDAVLRAFADRVRESVRSVDVLVRRGGEEFVLVLPGTALRRARGVAERVRRGLAERPLLVFEDLTVRQSVSIGVACWDREESPQALDERADHAMYEAKEGGRDRVVCSSPTRRTRRSFTQGPVAERARPRRMRRPIDGPR